MTNSFETVRIYGFKLEGGGGGGIFLKRFFEKFSALNKIN